MREIERRLGRLDERLESIEQQNTVLKVVAPDALSTPAGLAELAAEEARLKAQGMKAVFVVSGVPR